MDALEPETVKLVEEVKAAFAANDAGRVRAILNRHPQLKALIDQPVGPFESPAIVNARSREMLDALLDAGADINARSRWWAGGFGLLDSAEPELAAYAIERGAIVDAHAAARLGRLDRLRELVSKDPSVVHARGGDGQTPLHFARTTEVAVYLVDCGADIDARDVDHESTPAQYMVKERQDVARYLVTRGCRTDLLLAAALGDLDLARRHLDVDPGCIRIRVNEEFFPMVNPRAGGTIYQWTLGFHVTPHQVARKFGHQDVLTLLLERTPVDAKLIDACWMADEPTAQAIRREHPAIVESPHWVVAVGHLRLHPDAEAQGPASALRTAVAICPWPGASAERIEQLVTRKIEERVAENTKVDKIRIGVAQQRRDRLHHAPRAGADTERRVRRHQAEARRHPRSAAGAGPDPVTSRTSATPPR